VSVLLCGVYSRAIERSQAGNEDGVEIDFAVFDESVLKGAVRVRNQRMGQNLQHPMNYCRFFLPRLFPSLRKLIYLDTDVLVLGDIRQLWDAASFPNDEVLAAVAEEKVSLLGGLNLQRIDELYSERYGRRLPTWTQAFNAGMLLSQVHSKRSVCVSE
jgi:lipopolysaccharide biosynthesis glycosyltransferase